MSAFTSIRLQNNGPAANDLHLVFTSSVEVVGVDGVAPDAPTATYTLEGNDSATIDLSDISVPHANIITVRVKTKGPKKGALRKGKSFWTLDGEPIGKPF